MSSEKKSTKIVIRLSEAVADDPPEIIRELLNTAKEIEIEIGIAAKISKIPSTESSEYTRNKELENKVLDDVSDALQNRESVYSQKEDLKVELAKTFKVSDKTRTRLKAFMLKLAESGIIATVKKIGEYLAEGLKGLL